MKVWDPNGTSKVSPMMVHKLSVGPLPASPDSDTRWRTGYITAATEPDRNLPGIGPGPTHVLRLCARSASAQA